jgi:hypothetical protein
MRFGLIGCAFLAFALSASAEDVTWTLENVTFNDGVTASGSFTFNPDAGTNCSTGNSPCGAYSNIDITTTAGAGIAAETYLYACGSDVSTCTGLSPDSTQVLFLTSNASDQTGLEGLAFFFTAVGVMPPGGLTDAGGTFDISNSSINVGLVTEGTCSDAACSGPTDTVIYSESGDVMATPEPPTALLLGTSLVALFLFRLRAIYRREPVL